MINVPTWFAKPVLEFSAFRLGTSPRIEMEDHKMYYDKRMLWPLLVQAGFKPSQIKLRYRNFRMTLWHWPANEDRSVLELNDYVR